MTDKVISILDTYDSYVEDNKDTKVTFKDYCSLCYLYIQFLINKVLIGDRIALPGGLGYLFVKGIKPKVKIGDNGEIKNLAPDWVATKKLWEDNPESKKRKQMIYHTNEHTDGYRYSYHWNKLMINIANKSLYSLTMTRANKRTLSGLIKDGKEYREQKT